MAQIPHEDVLSLYDEGVEAFAATADGLTPAEWEQAACGEWTAAELARHVLAVAGWYHEWLDRAERGDPTPAFDAQDLALKNAEALGGLTDLDGPAAVAQFVDRARAYRDRLPAVWDLPFGYPRGTVTAGLHAGVAACEWHLHTWDLARARGRGYGASRPGHALRGGGRVHRRRRRRGEGPGGGRPGSRGCPTAALGGDPQALGESAGARRLISANRRGAARVPGSGPSARSRRSSRAR